MRTSLLALFLAVLLAVPMLSEASVWVSGYYRSDGTYVRGHYRSEPNGIKYDNYSWSPGDSLYNDSYYDSGYRNNWYQPSYTWDNDYYTGYQYNKNTLGSSFNNPYTESSWGSYDASSLGDSNNSYSRGSSYDYSYDWGNDYSNNTTGSYDYGNSFNSYDWSW